MFTVGDKSAPLAGNHIERPQITHALARTKKEVTNMDAHGPVFNRPFQLTVLNCETYLLTSLALPFFVHYLRPPSSRRDRSVQTHLWWGAGVHLFLRE